MTADRATRVVADADVLAADVLVGGESRDALDVVREHSWLTLVASEPLLDDAEAVLADLAAPGLAADWRGKMDGLAELVEHPAGDHPALACALHGDAAHVLTLDDRLLGADAAVAVRARVETSVRRPQAFVAVFDPAALYEGVVGDDYPGPDRDPRG
jgi:hypothetical protein